MGLIILGDLLEFFTVSRLKVIEQLRVSAEHAVEFAAAVEEMQRGLGTKHVEVLALGALAAGWLPDRRASE